MTYEEIAAAYDLQAEALLSVAPEKTLEALELKAQAADCRAKADYRRFEARIRESFLLVEERKAAAFESIAKALGGSDYLTLFGPRGTEIRREP